MNDQIVRIDHLSRHFRKHAALDGVTLDVARGTVFGLVGENGAGKTTLIKHLLGLMQPQQGSVTVFGIRPSEDPVGVLSKIGYLSENRDLPDWMGVAQFMNYSQAFYPNWDESYAEELREMFDLPENQKIKSLSRGQRARVGLIAALAHRPDFLVLDEPSSGLDSIVRHDILTAIIRTVADEGRTVLFSSHLLDEVERVADQVAMLHAGRIVLDAPLDQVLADHHLLSLDFDEPQTIPPSLSGSIGWKGSERNWTCVYKGEFDHLQINSVGAKVIDDRRPTLEDVFVAQAQVGN
jgi:ABC-2 type transport system ATP-binding protein